MVHVTVDVEDTEYQYLERAAKSSGTTVQIFLKHLIARQQRDDQSNPQETAMSSENTQHQKSRWAKLSERIQNNLPLRGAGAYVRQTSKEFKEDFTLSHDEA